MLCEPSTKSAMGWLMLVTQMCYWLLDGKVPGRWFAPYPTRRIHGISLCSMALSGHGWLRRGFLYPFDNAWPICSIKATLFTSKSLEAVVYNSLVHILALAFQWYYLGKKYSSCIHEREGASLLCLVMNNTALGCAICTSVWVHRVIQTWHGSNTQVFCFLGSVPGQLMWLLFVSTTPSVGRWSTPLHDF